MTNKRFKVGQQVKCGSVNYEIISISKIPYCIFEDGSKHYVMTLKKCNGDWDDVLFVNDAQIGEI